MNKLNHSVPWHFVCTLNAQVVYICRGRTPCAHITCAHKNKTHALITKCCQICTIDMHVSYVSDMRTSYVHAIWALNLCILYVHMVCAY